MKLIRLVIGVFEPTPRRWPTDVVQVDTSSVRVISNDSATPSGEGHLRLLVGEVEVTESLELTEDNHVIVPAESRQRAERAIETVSNLIAVANGVRRSLSSPEPCIAFVPVNDAEREWLERSNGIYLPIGGAIASSRIELDIFPLLPQLQDRLDGVGLLAEALAHGHATGRFHEYMRFFERAFGRNYKALPQLLTQYLQPLDWGYDQSEIDHWRSLRDPAIHGNAQEFLVESGLLPISERLEQAAYDVLFNKADWRSPNVKRRNVWTRTSGTTSGKSSNHFVTQGIGAVLQFAPLDPFGAYPWYLRKLTISSDTWFMRYYHEGQRSRWR